MDLSIHPSSWASLLATSPFLFPNYAFIPENYVHWTETPDSHIYSADLPGVRKEEIKVEVEDSRYLVIRTEMAAATTGEPVEAARSFRRKFQLPGMVDVAGISAGYEGGVLTVIVPRTFARRGFYIEPNRSSGRSCSSRFACLRWNRFQASGPVNPEQIGPAFSI